MFVTTFEIESLAMPSPVSETVIRNPPDELVRDSFSVQRASDDEEEVVVASKSDRFLELLVAAEEEEEEEEVAPASGVSTSVSLTDAEIGFLPLKLHTLWGNYGCRLASSVRAADFLIDGRGPNAMPPVRGDSDSSGGGVPRLV